MTFVQLTKFDSTPESARDTEGGNLLVNTDRIAEVSVETKVSEHTGQAEFKWLYVSLFSGGFLNVCPLDPRHDPMTPKDARDLKDDRLLELFQEAARRG